MAQTLHEPDTDDVAAQLAQTSLKE